MGVLSVYPAPIGTEEEAPSREVPHHPAVESSPALVSRDLRGGHITALDGIRGLAIIAVLIHHLFGFDVRGIGWLDHMYRVLSTGWIGVDLFFVLSGFLITGILIDARDKPSYFRNFYARRSVRIFPLYYGILFGGLLLGQLGREQIWLWTYTSNIRIALANDWIPLTTGRLRLWQFWSLAVEEHFYLVWPVVVFLCPPRWLLRVAIVLAVASCAARSFFVLETGRTLAAYLLTPFRVDGLLVGSACAVAMRSDRLRILLGRAAMPVLCICAALITAAYPLTLWNPSSKFVATVGYALLSVTFAAFIVVAITRGAHHWLRRLTELRVLRFFGKYSYGIYALHTTLFVLLLPLVSNALWLIIHSHTVAALLAKLVAIGATVVAAVVSWHVYEKHWLKLKRYFGGTATRPSTTG